MLSNEHSIDKLVFGKKEVYESISNYEIEKLLVDFDNTKELDKIIVDNPKIKVFKIKNL